LRYFSAIAPAATLPGLLVGEEMSDTYCFASGAASSSAAGFDAVFLEVGPICVTWSGIEIHFGVIVGSLVEVLDEHSYGCSKGCIKFCS
jgi:hypothetical protein